MPPPLSIAEGCDSVTVGHLRRRILSSSTKHDRGRELSERSASLGLRIFTCSRRDRSLLYICLYVCTARAFIAALNGELGGRHGSGRLVLTLFGHAYYTTRSVARRAVRTGYIVLFSCKYIFEPVSLPLHAELIPRGDIVVAEALGVKGRLGCRVSKLAPFFLQQNGGFWGNRALVVELRTCMRFEEFD